MSIPQLSIFIENRVGRLLELTKLFKDSGIDIKALSLSDTVDYGIFRLIVSHPDKAAEILKQNNIICRMDQVLAVIIEHRPGSLHQMLSILIEDHINVEYMYVTTANISGQVVVILSVDNTDKAIQALNHHGIQRAKLEDIE
jgi:hypothetical protein